MLGKAHNMRFTPSGKVCPQIHLCTVPMFSCYAFFRPFKRSPPPPPLPPRHRSLGGELQAIDNVTSLAFVLAGIVSSASTLLNFRDARHLSCLLFFLSSLCSVSSFDSGIHWILHSQESWNVDVEQCHIPVWASY